MHSYASVWEAMDSHLSQSQIAYVIKSQTSAAHLQHCHLVACLITILQLGVIVTLELLSFCTVVPFCTVVVPFCTFVVPFYTVLVPFCTVLVPFCTVIVPLCTVLVPFCTVLVPFCTVLVPFCTVIVLFCSYHFFEVVFFSSRLLML